MTAADTTEKGAGWAQLAKLLLMDAVSLAGWATPGKKEKGINLPLASLTALFARISCGYTRT